MDQADVYTGPVFLKESPILVRGMDSSILYPRINRIPLLMHTRAENEQAFAPVLV